MRRPRNGFCPQAAHRPPTLPPRELASAARAVFISITTAEPYGLGGARQPCFQESARRKSIGTRAIALMALMAQMTLLTETHQPSSPPLTHRLATTDSLR